MRLFIAINLPSEIKSEIGNLVRGLNDPGLKKVSPENLHFTLKFLGEMSDKQAEEIKEKLAEIKAKKFKVSFGGIGFFPSSDYIRVVWIGAEEGSEEIKSLQKEIDEKLEEFGFPKEKDFQPHLTIARVKFIRDRKKLMEKAEKIIISGSFEAESFDLMQSTLKPEGPEYKVVSGFALV